MDRSISQQLAKYALQTSFGDLTKDVVHATKRFLLDSLGSMIVGTIGPSYRIVRSVIENASQAQDSSVVGSLRKIWAPHAALINGVSLRYTEYSGHLLLKGLHGACHIDENLPAALATVEKARGSGKDLLVSLALAAELHARFLEAMDMSIPAWHHTTAGIYAVPIYCGKILGLNENQIANAVGISGSFGLTLDHIHYIGPVTMTRNLAYPLAAQQGITADLLAKEGYTGPLRIIEGRLGLLSHDPKAEPEKLTKLEPPVRILNYFNKVAPTSGKMALVDATKQLKDKYGIRPEQVERILIRTRPWMVPHSADPGNRIPQSKEAADHSAYYVVARTLIDGDLTIDQFTPEKVFGSDIKDLISKTEVVGDPKFDEMIRNDPVAQGFAVEIETSEGKSYKCTVDHARGYGRNRLTDSQLEDKFRFLARKALPSELVEQIITFVNKIESQDNIEPLMEIVRQSKAERAD